jgi:hypothetical protein
VLFFGLSTWVLALVLLAVIVGATLVGHLLGRSTGEHAEHVREPFAVIQAALIGFMGLLLAFAISLAVNRYEARTAAIVEEANAIDTTYLRAQTLGEPVRTESLALLQQFTDISIELTRTVPGSSAEQEAVAASGQVERRLWALAGQALADAPVASAPQLYVESLNQAFEAKSTSEYNLLNRVPTAVLLLEVFGAAIALAALALHLAALGRGFRTVLVAAVLVVLVLLVTFDLDRPARGMIRVPDEPLTELRASMAELTPGPVR